MNDVSGIIKKIATEGSLIQTCPAKVIRVNKEEGKSLHDESDAYTVDVMRPDGAEIKNVRLKASIQDKDTGVICIPKQDSWVLISIIETTETRAFISQYSEVEEVFLRIKKSDTDEYLQLNTKAGSVELLFKEKEGAIPSTGETDKKPPKYKDKARFSFTDTKSLIVDYLDDDGKKSIQKTTIAHDKVEVDFDEGKGYVATIDKDKVQFTNSTEKLDFKMEKKFKISVGDDNLKTHLDMLVDTVSKIIVVQGTGPNVGNLAKVTNGLQAILE